MVARTAARLDAMKVELTAEETVAKSVELLESTKVVKMVVKRGLK